MEDVCSKIVSHMLNREVCWLVSIACIVCGNASLAEAPAAGHRPSDGGMPGVSPAAGSGLRDLAGPRKEDGPRGRHCRPCTRALGASYISGFSPLPLLLFMCLEQ